MGAGGGRAGMQVPGLPCAGPLSHATSCDPVDSLAAGVSSAVRLPARALVFCLSCRASTCPVEAGEVSCSPPAR